MNTDKKPLLEVPDEVAGGTVRRPRPVTPQLLRSWPLPEPDGSKYGRGQVLVVGGARATPGAAMLSGLAALRMGSGRLTLAVAASIAPHVAVAIPECGAHGLAEDSRGSITGIDAGAVLADELQQASAILVGPGLDDAGGAARLLAQIVEALPEQTPVVLDAFGATVLPGADRSVLDSLAGRLVLTPNTGELARLLEVDDIADDDLAGSTLRCAERFGAAVGCKAWVASDGALWQMTDGDSGLATSGSGDVMAGAVLGLLGRGATLPQALAWGKHVHAVAGAMLSARHGRVGFLAGELGSELPRVMRTLGGD